MEETINIEQTVLEKFRKLSPQKQQKVLKFVESLQQEKIEPPTEEERVHLNFAKIAKIAAIEIAAT